MATVRIEQRVSDAQLAAIAADTSLVSLEICDGRELSAKGLGALATARGLRKLSVSQMKKVVDKGIDALAGLALEEIRLTHSSKLGEKSLARLATIESLRAVDASFCAGITDGAVEAIVGSPHSRNSRSTPAPTSPIGRSSTSEAPRSFGSSTWGRASFARWEPIGSPPRE